jgi:citrate synthase
MCLQFPNAQKVGTDLLCFSTGRDELLEIAMVLHDAAMKDEYFIKRRLAPNVDFW